MSKSSGFDRGVLAGMLIAFGAFSGNWLITPHPGASTLRTIGVVAQVVLGIGVGAWLIVRERSLQKRQAAAVDAPTMSRSIRARRGVIALALTIWSEACVVHRPMPGDGSLRPGTDVRIRSPAPLDLNRQTDTLWAIPVCCTNVVEGRFVRVAGDTIVLERGSGFAVTSDLSRIPVQREILTVVRTSETEVTVRQVDGARTTALLVGITAAVVGLLALAASQIQYGLPSGGGTFFLGAPVILPR